MRLSEFIFSADYDSADGGLLRFIFGANHGNTPDVEGGISSELLYVWLQASPVANDAKCDFVRLRSDVSGNGWAAEGTELSVLALLTIGGISITEVGQTALADWYTDRFGGLRDNYVVTYSVIPTHQERFRDDAPDLTGKLDSCWEQVSAADPDLADVLVGPLLMLLPKTDDALKMKILQREVPDAVPIAKTHSGMSDSVKVTAALMDESKIRSRGQEYDFGSITRIPDYALEEQYDLNQTLGYVGALAEELISLVMNRLPETSITSTCAPDYSRGSGEKFPSYQQLDSLVDSSVNPMAYHRDVVLAALMHEEQIRVSPEVRDGIKATLQSLDESTSIANISDLVRSSWTNSLSDWDSLT